MPSGYLDHNATTPLDSRVLEAMMPYMREKYANPSSIYSLAQETKEAIEDARETVAQHLNNTEGKLIFTGGGSEANNLAIKGVAFANIDKGKHLITSQIEHHAVLEPCEYLEKLGFEVTYLPVGADGIVELEGLRKAIREDTILITVMYANNETGVIQPVEEIARIAHERGICFHTDAVQVMGKRRVNAEELGVDLLSMSGHKFYGPKGVGALSIRKGVKIHPLVHGGGHEQGLRAGTENVPGIVGLATALDIAMADVEQEWEREKRLRDQLERGLLENIAEIQINGHREKRLPNTTNILVKYVEGESMLMLLETEEIYASSGSACTSGSLDPSHVLLAMGIPAELAHGSLRFSLGRKSKAEDIERVLEVLPGIVERLRELSPFGRNKDGI